MVDQVELRWQPIETAPKDGTWLLLFVPEGIEERSYEAPHALRMTIGHYDAAEYQQSQWLSIESWTEYTDYGGYTGVSVSTYLCPIRPTHWMPLPPHPNNTGEV